MWNWPYPLNILVYSDKILHTYYYWHDLDRGIAKSSPRDWKMTFNIGRGCAELQILKKWKWLNWVDYCNETLHTHWYWQDVAHLGLAEVLSRFKFWKTVKLTLSPETFWIFWYNYAQHCYWSWARQRDCQVSFIISRGYAEVQILKTSESDPFSFWNILICICPNSEKSKMKRALHIFICKKKIVQTHLYIIFLFVT